MINSLNTRFSRDYPIKRKMGDLHSIAYSTSSLHSSHLDWEWDHVHNLGLLNADISHLMESSPPVFSPLEPDISSGYLQDALFEFGDRSKRRRLLLFDDQNSKDSIKNLWNSNDAENFNYVSLIRNSIDGFSGEGMNQSVREYASVLTETPKEAISASQTSESSSSSQQDLVNIKSTSQIQSTLYNSIDGGVGEKRKKREILIRRRVVYPFAMVKPGGLEGDLTLNDINRRILMPPTRPVRHPVGEFACRPHGHGHGGCSLSGKSVLAFTTIHTLGRRGTITIIRTKA